MADVELRDVTKVFGGQVTAVSRMSLLVRNGELLALLGPSGCGKSTTLLMLAGMYAPTDGEILFDGQVINDVEARDRNVGIVFQSYALYPHMTVRQNLHFPLRFKKIPTEEAKRLIDEAARLVQIDMLLDRRPNQLSGGQQQRVALARALVKQPQLLLLDEPLSNLDATLRLAMRSELKALQRRLGITTILVTHDQIEAMTMADRIVCMNHGRIQQVGRPDDLYLRPANLFVAGFIGAPPINLVPGSLEGGRFHTKGVRLRCVGEAYSGAATLGIRPEHLRFDQSGIAGRVAQVEPMGRENLYQVFSALGDLWVLQPRAAASREIDEEVRLSFETQDSILFNSDQGTLLQGLRVETPKSEDARSGS